MCESAPGDARDLSELLHDVTRETVAVESIRPDELLRLIQEIGFDGAENGLKFMSGSGRGTRATDLSRYHKSGESRPL